jgi:amino acid permease
MPKLDIKTIDERLPAPMVAILFWMLAGLLVLLAMAGAKDRWLEVGIAAIGAIGQVAIAVLVYRLSRDQFQFTKQMTERQHRLELYPLRRDALRALRNLEDVAYNARRIQSDDLALIHETAVEISHVFNEEIATAAFLFEEAAIRCADS